MNNKTQARTTTSLCDSKGQLNPQAIGFSSRPVIDCAIPGHFGRRKRWNHWNIIGPKWMLTLIQADFDYMGLACAHFVDLHTGKSYDFNRSRLFSMDCHLPDRPFESHYFEHALLQLNVNEHAQHTIITLSASGHGSDLIQAIIYIQRPAHMDSSNLVAPLGPNSFHATSRLVGMPCTGNIQINNDLYECNVAQCFASMEFGRGVWPIQSHWNRVAFAAPGGIAANFGSGWAEHSGLSENTLWFGGQAFNLDAEITIQAESDSPKAPRHLHSTDGNVQLTFTPRQHHQQRHRFGLLYVDNQQLIGHFSGTLRDPHKECVPVNKALGWLGEIHTRW